MNSNRHVAVWIDHHEAHVFHVDAATLDETTLRAPEHRLRRHPKGPGAQHEHPDDEHHFFRDVAKALENAERVLVVGPGTAKLHFLRYAQKHDPKLEPRIVAVETVDHPTDGQLVAFAKRAFAADDRMHGLPGAGVPPRS